MVVEIKMFLLFNSGPLIYLDSTKQMPEIGVTIPDFHGNLNILLFYLKRM